MIALVAALLAVFVLIIYLDSGFYVSIRQTLGNLGAAMDKVAAGDMTVSFKAHSRDELGELGQGFNQTVLRIRELIDQVGRTVSTVEEQAGQVLEVSVRSNQAVSGQREQIEQVATAMNQMSATSRRSPAVQPWPPKARNRSIARAPPAVAWWKTSRTASPAWPGRLTRAWLRSTSWPVTARPSAGCWR